MNVEKNPRKKMFEVYKNGGKVNDAILRLFIISAWNLGVFFLSTETIELVRVCLSSTLNFMIHHALSTFFFHHHVAFDLHVFMQLANHFWLQVTSFRI